MPRLKRPIVTSLKKWPDLPNLTDEEIDRDFADVTKRALQDWKELGADIKDPDKLISLTRRQYQKFVDTFFLLYGKIEATRIRGRDRRVALEERVEALENRPELKHCGTWESDKLYKQSSLVTCAGGLWLALRSNKQRPGSSSAWRLIVKSGNAQ